MDARTAALERRITLQWLAIWALVAALAASTALRLDPEECSRRICAGGPVYSVSSFRCTCAEEVGLGGVWGGAPREGQGM